MAKTKKYRCSKGSRSGKKGGTRVSTRGTNAVKRTRTSARIATKAENERINQVIRLPDFITKPCTAIQREYKIDLDKCNELKQAHIRKSIPTTFLPNVLNEISYKVLNHLHEVSPGPILPLIAPRQGMQLYGVDESDSNFKTEVEPSDDYRASDGSYQVEYTDTDTENHNIKVRPEIADAVKHMNIDIILRNPARSNITLYDIPIYFVIVIGAEHKIHLSILVMYRQRLYSLGLGYTSTDINFAGFQEGEAGLYSPDYLIDIENDRKNRIVDIGILNTHNISIINEYADKVKQVTVSFDEEKDIKNILWTCADCRYCTVSCTDSECNVNCTSFITKIFPEINCDFLGSIVAPSRCNTKPPISREYINAFFTLYSQGNLVGVLNHIK